MPNPQPFISLNDISIRVRDQIAFNGLCWEILNDQHWAVIGPNGSGKSTLMKAMCGELPIVKGKIVFHFLRDGESARDQIAYVTFESQRLPLGNDSFHQSRWNFGVYEDSLTVAEYLSEQNVKRVNPFHVAEIHGDEKFSERQYKVLEQLELDALLKKNVVQLSNGERRKVSIARALLKNPKLLILDNPFVGLDERFRIKFAENLENLLQGETHAPARSASVRVVIVGTNRDEIPRGITHVLDLSLRGAHFATKQSPRCNSEIASQKTLAMTTSQLDQKSDIHEPARTVFVQMQNVNVSYNGTPILRKINWTVRENEKWALLGPNGAGKTTLLSLILADNPQAYANDITLFGKPRGSGESIWEIKQKIGWVAPELHLHHPRNSSCLDVVCSGWFDSVGLYRQCSASQRATAMMWLQRFGLSERADETFEQISEGEQRLTLLARALVKNPALLVLDEPCQGLDVGNRDRVLQAIDSLGETSMIYVTHRADELPQNITHVLRLNAGRVVGEIRNVIASEAKQSPTPTKETPALFTEPFGLACGASVASSTQTVSSQ